MRKIGVSMTVLEGSFVGFLVGMFITGIILSVLVGFEMDNKMLEKYAECVDSVKIPVGECSRLFRGEK